MRRDQTVSELVVEILAYQAKILVDRTGQSFENALVAILKSDAGRQLEVLADGPHRHEKARDWLASLAWEDAEGSHLSWVKAHMELLKDKEARSEYQAFLKQALVPLMR